MRNRERAGSAAAVLEAAENDAALDTNVSGPGGEMPLGRLLCQRWIVLQHLLHRISLLEHDGCSQIQFVAGCQDRLHDRSVVLFHPVIQVAVGAMFDLAA